MLPEVSPTGPFSRPTRVPSGIFAHPMGSAPGNDDRNGRGGSDIAWTIIGLLLSGVIAWGGIGWLVDRWLDTNLFLPIGILVGAAGAFYLVIRRYGQG
jgi:F0F1-type ATP synthase assembly protein I